MIARISRLGRVGRLAFAHVHASIVRSVLLSLSIAIGFLVFSGVTALGDASQSGLDAAIESDLGRQGTYLAAIETSSTEEADTAARVAARVFGPESSWFGALSDYSATDLSCPTVSGPREDAPLLYLLLAQRGEPGTPARSSAATSAPAPSRSSRARSRDVGAPGEVCIGGAATSTSNWPMLMLPVAITGGRPAAVAPPGLATELRLQFGGPRRVMVIVIAGGSSDRTSTLRSALGKALVQADGRWVAAPPTVDRLDDGSATRGAANGVRAVYGVIAWSVLVLGGIGLLVAELMGAKARIWFFGLARVVGATSSDLAVLVLADVAVIVVAGALFAAGAAAAVSRPVSQWSRDTLGVSIELLAPSTMRQLALGAVVVALVGALIPAWRASRSDPLVALESRGS